MCDVKTEAGYVEYADDYCYGCKQTVWPETIGFVINGHVICATCEEWPSNLDTLALIIKRDFAVAALRIEWLINCWPKGTVFL
jgi:hypothetical protein